MFLLLDQQDLIVDMSDHIIPTKRQSNGVIVACQEDDSDTIYACDTDTYYPLSLYHTKEIEDVPNNVVSGYWYYRDGFFTTAKKMYAYRDELLNQCDLIYCNPSNWSAMDEATRAVWQEYKQALRDIPQQTGFPFSVSFPALPAQEIKSMGGFHMILTMADGTRLYCIGNTGANQSYKGVYRPGVCIKFDPQDYTDQELRTIFTDTAKTKSMTITGADKPIEGYTLFVRSYYQEGQIGIELVKEVSVRETQLMEQSEVQAAAVATIIGVTPDAITPELAQTTRDNIEMLVSYAPDQEAAKAPSLYPYWIVGEAVVPGDRRYYTPTQKLYKVRDGQGHTTQADWTPDKTPNLWEVIDVVHAGTQDDPIPAAKGMEYTYGKYYLDPEDGKLYLCQREGVEDGGTINLQYLPHELVNQYFVEVEVSNNNEDMD